MSSGSYSQKARLTEEQKKSNHNTSEHARRQAIREQFDQLADMIPGYEGKGASEAKVMTATVDFLKSQLDRKAQLHDEAMHAGVSEGDFEQIYRVEEKAAFDKEAKRALERANIRPDPVVLSRTTNKSSMQSTPHRSSGSPGSIDRTVKEQTPSDTDRVSVKQHAGRNGHQSLQNGVDEHGSNRK